MPKKKTPHVGDYVWSVVIEPKGLTVGAAATLLGVLRVTLSALVNRKAALSPEMALRIELVFQVPIERLLRMQADWDAAEIRKIAKELHIRRYSPKNVVLERHGKRGKPTMRVLAPRSRNAVREAKPEYVQTVRETIESESLPAYHEIIPEQEVEVLELEFW